ncbi:MAG: F0F1 ATP synthase subunit A [Thermodesulfobacteriota bacterium]
MKFSPDHLIIIDWGWGRLNATILCTWLEMILLAGGAWCVTRKLDCTIPTGRRQALLEMVVGAIAAHIEEITRKQAAPFLPFVGTLFLFILLSNILSVVPFYPAPTASLSTTSALAFLVFIAVPVFGLATRSAASYLGEYLKPSPVMLPFNLLGDISRTVALAVRLYGNLLSSTVIAFVLLLITPFLVPVPMSALGLLTGTIQAYIFALLAMVYIASMLKNDTLPESHRPEQSTVPPD